ncbi:hypothetical protein PUW81_011465 [Microbacterium sp. NM3R9]|uniref:hypothetical protein n=1 Tax=Microbacterium thalli TaxID=3027921 RepID=UPI00236605A9|nr:hypothetical protein [Microbacterium thalli]MDD7930604.1 hypothetical protein [Microbacterium thalli]MDN8549724.1 hypothetical protein [Microbacterium thalli]
MFRSRSRRAVLPAAGALALLAALVVGEAALPSAAAVAAPASLILAAAPASSAAVVTEAVEPPAVEWGVVPADDAGPDGRVSLRHVVDPGTSVRDAIAVTNHSAEDAAFAVATGDGVVGTDGAFDVRTDDPAAGGAWLQVDGLDGGALTLASGETRVLPVTIAVPADATPGDHPAGIVVALSTEDAGVTLTHRVGVRVHLQVAGEIAPALRVDAATASYSPSWVPFAPGTLTVEYRVTNTGNVRFGASAAADASGPLGLMPGAGTGEAFEVLPGGTATQRIEVPLAPMFFAAGEVTVTPVSLGDDRVPLPEAASAGFSTPAVPWSSLAVVMLGAGIAALVAMLVVRGRGRTQRRIDAAVAADRAGR